MQAKCSRHTLKLCFSKKHMLNYFFLLQMSAQPQQLHLVESSQRHSMLHSTLTHALHTDVQTVTMVGVDT